MPHRAEALLSINRIPPTRYLELFNASLTEFCEEAAEAAIRIETSGAEVILAAGEDDHLWPSAWFARALARRLETHGRSANLIVHPEAGHRILLPGETVSSSKVNKHGGTDEGDAALGKRVWDQLAQWSMRSTPRPETS